MDNLLDRFIRYVKIDTQSDETSTTAPSTAKQLDLCRLLRDECEQLGLQNVVMDDHGTVSATIPASAGCTSPAIAWFAHVDTSPEYSGTNVKPIIHENYSGGDITLPGDPSQVIRVSENQALEQLMGATIITSDGSTLLGADDKAGVAVIMSAAESLINNAEIPHGPIRVCFTCDEEIGRGVDHVDVDAIDAVCGYTLDGDGIGKIDCETFSADLAVVTVRGVNTHPSIGRGVMVNAIRILSRFLDRLPKDKLSPESTDERDGFLHPYHVEGGVAEASARIILRDFETEKLAEYAGLLEGIAVELRGEYPRAAVEIEVKPQYRNMRDGLVKEPRALAKAIEATQAAGIKSEQSIIRGGTDGSRLTELGLPTPNLSTGEHNPHSPQEWTSVEEMQHAVDVLIQLARVWGHETG